MSPHERALDHLTDQLRRDALDETTNVDNLDKALQFFQVGYANLEFIIFRECMYLCISRVVELKTCFTSLVSTVEIHQTNSNI